jgi:DNA-binding MarR family transcriptional regulator
MIKPKPRRSTPDPRPAAQKTAADDSHDASLLYDLVLPLFVIRGRLVVRMEEECAACGITPSEAVVLLHLSQRALTVSEVSRAAGLQRSGGSVLVERLHQGGLVSRLPSASDRRVMHVQITAAGRRLTTKLSRGLADDTSDLSTALSERQREQLFACLRILAEIDGPR